MIRRLTDRCADRTESRDEGTTLVELLVGIGIFSVLMAIVGTATLTLFSAIQEANARSQAQTETQNAMEWIARLVQHADAPDVSTNVMPEATATSLTLYAYPGLGAQVDEPSKVRIWTETSSAGTSVLSEVWAPVRSGSSWTWNSVPARRTLLTIAPDVSGAPLSLRYFACTPSVGCDSPQEVQPNASGPLPIGALQVPAAILVTLGDPNYPTSRVVQSIRLVNEA